MPWARIPPDKLVHLPMFGIDVIKDDGDFVWMHGSRGRMRVDKRAPRIWFDDVADAHQAGATSIRIADADEERQYTELMKAMEENSSDDDQNETAPPGEDAATP